MDSRPRSELQVPGVLVVSDGAFVRAFKAEMDAAAHQALVETYTWANNMTFGAPSAELRERGEAWAKQIEDAGQTWEVLQALAREEPTHGIVTCCVCGHTEDAQTAEERWAYRPIAEQWMCDECWLDDKDFPEEAAPECPS